MSLTYLQRFMQWFRREWDEGYIRAEKLYTGLLNDVREGMNAGTAKECMSTRGLRDQESLGVTDVQLAFAMSAPFGAGIETVSPSKLLEHCWYLPTVTYVQTSATIEIGLCELLRSYALQVS